MPWLCDRRVSLVAPKHQYKKIRLRGYGRMTQKAGSKSHQPGISFFPTMRCSPDLYGTPTLRARLRDLICRRVWKRILAILRQQSKLICRERTGKTCWSMIIGRTRYTVHIQSKHRCADATYQSEDHFHKDQA